MKKVLVSALAMMATLSIYAQGTINFANTVSTKVMVDNGTSVVAAPVGSTYQVGLYWAPVGTVNESAFQMVGAAAGFQPLAGMFSGGKRTIPALTAGGIAPGGLVLVQVRGWEAAAGGYDAASTTVGKFSGKSSIFQVDTGDPTTVPAGTDAAITSSTAPMFTGFTMIQTQVPEPSTIALGLMGIAGLFLLRRRS